MILNFDPIKIYGKRRGKCSNCGKKRVQSKTFMQTLNPFNKNIHTGLLKTNKQIIVELKTERDEWESKPTTCKTLDYWGEMNDSQRKKYDETEILTLSCEV